jgi:RNA-directed DNA polymerase
MDPQLSGNALRRAGETQEKRRQYPVWERPFALVQQGRGGWANYYRHTNASQAYRTLQRFLNNRFRRYLTYRSKGRGFGWKQFPNKTLYAKGLIYIGSRYLRYAGAPVHAL